MMIDTHCHIQSADWNASDDHTAGMWYKSGLTVQAMIASAREAGVAQMICVGCDPNDSQSAVSLAKREPVCFAAAAIHPHAADRYLDEQDELAGLAQLISSKEPKLVAIGECGLDYFYRHSDIRNQQELLDWHLNLARQTNLPLIFHVRQAFDDFWPLLDRAGSFRGVLHSFTDSQANLDKAIERGLLIGVNGIATFTKDSEQLAMLRNIPLTRLVLETDAPYLTPTPYRGTVNEPKHIRTIANFLADLRGEDPELIARQTTTNAQRLFGL